MEIKKEVIHVYFIPGMAVDSSIFENIRLPKEQFEVHWLEWEIPEKDESLTQYSRRIITNIHHDDIVLIGVSFGGVVAQEISNFLKLRRLIIVSSVKSRDELPTRMKFASKTGIFKLLPLSLLNYIDHIENFAPNNFIKKRARLYKKYLSVKSNTYLKWAIKNMVCWDQESPKKEITHIHGDKDIVFPYKNIKGCITVKGGTHIMIVNRYRWFNKNLPEIILTGKLKMNNKYQKTEL